MEKQPILIIAAMEDVEMHYLKKEIENIKRVESKIATFYKGEILETPIVLMVSNIGTINSAAAITLGIEKYNPSIIINEGIAGGYGRNIHTKDIVIGTKTVNITSMETMKRKEGEGTNLSNYELITFIKGEKNKLIYQNGDKDLIEKAKEVEYKEGKVHLGTIGSGDIWNKEADRILYLNNSYEIMCEDMESISIYTIANLYKIPVIAIKAISNNEILNEEYQRSIGINAQKFTLSLIDNILDK